MNILITGGLGFIGINTTLRYVNKADNIILFDNLNKIGSLENLKLVRDYPNVKFIKGDLRNYNDVQNVFKGSMFDVIFHLGGQTAVTTSLENPKMDFESNATGTFNILECMREYTPEAKLIFTSTNKVYGNLNGRNLTESSKRYVFTDNISGIDETENLDFYSPYGCSKGAADQYVRDYHRIYGLDTVVLRQSCIYGKYQNGTEDQGWVAWFIKRFIEGGKITIFGDGKQVRDILYIDDLIDLYELIVDKTKGGEIYNIGGGMGNTTSILEIMETLNEKIPKNNVVISYSDERDGDQKIFISSNKLIKDLGWYPKISIDSGVDKLITYLKEKYEDIDVLSVRKG
jgi:CDP-paratose 2-epimerase